MGGSLRAQLGRCTDRSVRQSGAAVPRPRCASTTVESDARGSKRSSPDRNGGDVSCLQMNPEDRDGDGPESVGDPRLEDPEAVADTQRASRADQTSADADQSAADRHDAAAVDLTAADERAYEASRDERGRARDARDADVQNASGGWDVLRRREGETSEESGAKYRGLLEAAPDAMVVVNPVSYTHLRAHETR